MLLNQTSFEGSASSPSPTVDLPKGGERDLSMMTTDFSIAAITATTEPNGEYTPQVFTKWLEAAGLSGRFPLEAPSEGEKGKEYARRVLEKKFGTRKTLAHSFLALLEEDGRNHDVPYRVDPRVTLVTRLGKGGSSSVFASSVEDPGALLHGAPLFADQIAAAAAKMRHNADESESVGPADWVVEVQDLGNQLVQRNVKLNGKLPPDVELFVTSLHDRTHVPKSRIGEEIRHAVEVASLRKNIEANVRSLMEKGSHPLVVTKVIDNALGRVGREVMLQVQMQDALPCVPRIAGGEVTDRRTIIHMNHEPGYDGEVLFGNERIDLRTTCDYAALAARNQYFVDKARLVHRDIKPANSFITSRGSVKLLDLGLARRINNETMGYTQSGDACGTPDYIAPEVARGDRNIDGRADVFSLGIKIVRMLTGRVPYRGKDGQAVATMVRHNKLSVDEAESVDLGVADDPAEQKFRDVLSLFLSRMIHPESEERPTPEEVARFFHEHSSYGDSNFDKEFANPAKYDDYRLEPDPIARVGVGDSAIFPAYEGGAGEMLKAIVAGSHKRVKQYDFLKNPEYANAKHSTKRRIDAHRSSNKRRILTTVGVAAAAVLGLSLAWNAMRKDDSANGDQQQPAPGKVEPLVKDVTSKEAKEQLPYKRVVDWKIAEDGHLESLSVFSVDIPKERMCALYTFNNGLKEQCGVAFFLNKDILMKIAKADRRDQFKLNAALGFAVWRKEQGDIYVSITDIGTTYDDGKTHSRFGTNDDVIRGLRRPDSQKVGELVEMNAEECTYGLLTSAPVIVSADTPPTGYFPIGFFNEKKDDKSRPDQRVQHTIASTINYEASSAKKLRIQREEQARKKEANQ